MTTKTFGHSGSDCDCDLGCGVTSLCRPLILAAAAEVDSGLDASLPVLLKARKDRTTLEAMSDDLSHSWVLLLSLS